MIAIWDGNRKWIDRWASLSELPAEQRAKWSALVADKENWNYPLWIMADINGRDVIITGLETGQGTVCEKYRRAAGDGLNAQSRTKFAYCGSGSEVISITEPAPIQNRLSTEPRTTATALTCALPGSTMCGFDPNTPGSTPGGGSGAAGGGTPLGGGESRPVNIGASLIEQEIQAEERPTRFPPWLLIWLVITFLVLWSKRDKND